MEKKKSNNKINNMKSDDKPRKIVNFSQRNTLTILEPQNSSLFGDQQFYGISSESENHNLFHSPCNLKNKSRSKDLKYEDFSFFTSINLKESSFLTSMEDENHTEIKALPEYDFFNQGNDILVDLLSCDSDHKEENDA